MKKLFILFAILTLSMGSFAQSNEKKDNRPPRQRISKEDFRKRVQQHIAKDAELTEEESKVFFPIYNEYKDKQMAIHAQIRTLKKETKQSASEEECKDNILEIAKLNNEMAELDIQYYKKLCKAISAKKFYKVLSLEDQMHRNILRNYNRRDNRKDGNHNRPRWNKDKE